MAHLLPDSSQPHEAEPVDDLAELRNELADLREDMEQLKQAYQSDRDVMGRMLHALRAVFGGNLEAAPAAAPTSGIPQPPNEAAWRMWKERLPEPCGRIIDGLLIQPLTQTQMSRMARIHTSNISRYLQILRSNSLVEKDGDRWRLKRL